MRIIGGKFRGRILSKPRTYSIRPTTDRVRESIFNILSHVYPEVLSATRMIDMFAGVGAVGFEALSRGCLHVLFVDNNNESLDLIRKNIRILGVEENASFLLCDALNIGQFTKIEPFQFIFLDPPYGKGLGEKALFSAAAGGWLESNTLVIIEEHVDYQLSVDPVFKFLQRRRFRDTQVHFFRYCPVSHYFPIN